MELVYIWIEEHKNIKKQGFNFCPDYYFKFEKSDGEGNDKKYYFNYEELYGNKKRIPQNFFGENISNVTGIIGKNGSGKSSVIESFTNVLRYKKYSSSEQVKLKKIQYKTIIYFFRDSERNIYFSVRNANLKSNVFLNDDLLRHQQAFPQIIYYDNIILKKPVNNRENKTILNNLNISSQNIFLENTLNFSNFASKESEKTILFLGRYSKIDDLKESIKIKFPESAYLSLSDQQISNIDEFNNKLVRKVTLTVLDKFNVKNWAKNSLIPDEMEEKYNEFLLSGSGEVFITLKQIFEKFQKQKNDEAYDVFINRNNFSIFEKEIINELNLYANRLAELTGNQDKENELKNYFEFIRNFYQNIYLEYRDHLTSGNSKVIIFEEDKLKISLDKQSSLGLSKFCEENNKISLEQNFLSYSFDIDMSSGERAMLALFSRFYFIKFKLNPKKEGVIIAMDEPEMFMHPEWQRHFLNIFIKFINIIFPNKKVQIILTSHSPFVTNDLPKENIIMLETYVDGDYKTELEKHHHDYQVIGNCKVINKEDKNARVIGKTFGANIHDLYKSSFFLNSTMGEFSLNKIKEVIENLTTLECLIRTIKKEKEKELNSGFENSINVTNLEKQKKDIEEREDTIKYIIDSIGEKVLSRKLNEKYREVFGVKENKQKKLNDVEEFLKSKGYKEGRIKDILKNLGDE